MSWPLRRLLWSWVKRNTTHTSAANVKTLGALPWIAAMHRPVHATPSFPNKEKTFFIEKKSTCFTHPHPHSLRFSEHPVTERLYVAIRYSSEQLKDISTHRSTEQSKASHDTAFATPLIRKQGQGLSMPIASTSQAASTGPPSRHVALRTTNGLTALILRREEAPPYGWQWARRSLGRNMHQNHTRLPMRATHSHSYL